ncbi:MAG: hypothetical protein AAFU79_35915 [Myxococcota bacterium]
MPRDDAIAAAVILFKHIDPEFHELTEFLQLCLGSVLAECFAEEFAEAEDVLPDPYCECPHCGGECP